MNAIAPILPCTHYVQPRQPDRSDIYVVPLKNSDALRSPAFGGEGGQSGAIVDVTSNRILLTESSNEKKFVKTLLADRQVKTVREQPARIPYLGSDGEWHDRLFLGRTPFGTAGEVSKGLGRYPREAASDFANLVHAGIIQQETGASTADLPPIFSKPAFDAAMAQFIARFEPTDPHAQGMAGISVISATYHLTLGDLWKLLASGSITRMGRIAEQGTFGGMRFDMREILAAITGICEPLTVNDVADRLGVNSSKVRNLVYKEKLMPSPLRTDIKIGLVHVFAKATIEAFETEFLSSKHTRSMIEGTPPLTKLKYPF